MAGSSNAVGVSTLSPELALMLASNINVSNFVTVKLSGQSNYRIWETQMFCLLDSQALRDALMGRYYCPNDMRYQYEQLVSGWILSSVNEEVLNDLVRHFFNQPLYPCNIWLKIQSSYMPPFYERYLEGTYSNNYPFLMSHCLNETVSIRLLNLFSF
ncbi:hypothetical protein Hanom_Chr03g00190321 [Helianthus anomalus]